MILLNKGENFHSITLKSNVVFLFAHWNLAYSRTHWFISFKEVFDSSRDGFRLFHFLNKVIGLVMNIFLLPQLLFPIEARGDTNSSLKDIFCWVKYLKKYYCLDHTPDFMFSNKLKLRLKKRQPPHPLPSSMDK